MNVSELFFFFFLYAVKWLQVSLCNSNSSIWPIDKTLFGATTLGQSGPESNENEGGLGIPQSSIITEALLSGCLVSYLGHL